MARILFLTNAYCRTAVPYIKKLIDNNKNLVGVVLLKRIRSGKKGIKTIWRKLKKFGLGHIIKRIVEVVLIKMNYLAKKMNMAKNVDYKSVEDLLIDHPVNTLVLEDVNCQESINLLKDLKPDILFVCTFSQIISEDVIRIPAAACINIHAGLLPKYRGPASNFWVLYNNEKKTGVTYHHMTKGIDDGDIILQKELEILSDDTEETLDVRLSEIGAESIYDVVEQITSGTAKRIPQSKEESTYFTQPKSKQRKELIQMRKKKNAE